MKIGIDARPLIEAPTGIGIYLYNALNALRRLETAHHYYLISSAEIRSGFQHGRWKEVSRGLKLPGLGSAWLQAWGPVLAERLGLDLFWGTRHHLPVWTPRRIKCLLTVHDVVHRRHPETMTLRNLILERLLMGFSVRRASLVLADSRSTAGDLQKYYPAAAGKIRVVYPGAPDPGPPDASFLPEGLPERFLLFVGTMEPRKNFRRLLRAYLDTRPEEHGVHLVVAGGRGWKSQALVNGTVFKAAADFVHRLGYVSRPQLFGLYRQALAVVLPSLYEGFGFPILEAMACGTAVITSRRSSMPEAAGNAALLVDPFDVGSIGRAIRQIIQRQDLRLALARKGREQVCRFRWDTYARQLATAFEDLSR